jgi:hypothetical protein
MLNSTQILFFLYYHDIRRKFLAVSNDTIILRREIMGYIRWILSFQPNFLHTHELKIEFLTIYLRGPCLYDQVYKNNFKNLIYANFLTFYFHVKSLRTKHNYRLLHTLIIFRNSHTKTIRLLTKMIIRFKVSFPITSIFDSFCFFFLTITYFTILNRARHKKANSKK